MQNKTGHNSRRLKFTILFVILLMLYLQAVLDGLL